MPDHILDAPEAVALDPIALAAKLVDERPADIVEVLNEQAPETAALILRHLPHERAIEVLTRLDRQGDVLSSTMRADGSSTCTTGMDFQAPSQRSHLAHRNTRGWLGCRRPERMPRVGRRRRGSGRTGVRQRR